MRTAVSVIEKFIPKDAGILDVGCAGGNLLEELRKKGYICLRGLEPSAVNAEYAKERFGLNVDVGGIGSDLNFYDKKFDLVIVEQVLEHIFDLDAAITQLSDLITDKGYLGIGVPDSDLYADKIDLYQQFSSEHINYFSLGSLENLMHIHGFKLASCVQSKEQMTMHTLWQKSESKENILYDTKGVDNIRKYLSVNDEAIRRVKDEGVIKPDKYYNVWGTGTLLAALIQFGVIPMDHVLNIVDGNKNYQGHDIYGHKIISPGEIKDDNPILICSLSSAESIRHAARDIFHINNPLLNILV